jgi:hypothetical protein
MAGGNLPFGLAPSGELTSYTPTLRERATDFVRRSLFSDDRAGQGKANRVMDVASVTPFGFGLDVYDAGREAGQGNLGAAAVMMGMAGIPGKAPLKLHHGSRTAGLRELKPSEAGTGALGPGVYGTPFRHTAERYGDNVYDLTAPDEIFYGAGERWDDIPSSMSKYQVWRDQVEELAAANPEQADMIRAAGDKMLYDGYPFFRKLAYEMGSKEAAQELYKRAGYKGLSAMVDGPEVVMFDSIPLEVK